jgi:hypothetical protein
MDVDDALLSAFRGLYSSQAETGGFEPYKRICKPTTIVNTFE